MRKTVKKNSAAAYSQTECSLGGKSFVCMQNGKEREDEEEGGGGGT